MLGEIVGYALPKRDAQGVSAIDLTNFQGKPCRALEINKSTSSILLIDSGGTGIGMFDFDQMQTMFECRDCSGLLVPKELNEIEAFLYCGKVFSYSQNRQRDMKAIRALVITQSLMKGAFCDTLYFNFAS